MLTDQSNAAVRSFEPGSLCERGKCMVQQLVVELFAGAAVVRCTCEDLTTVGEGHVASVG